MSNAVQRKAWNEAMRNAAGASAILPVVANHKRRSDRRKKQDRRDKARKVTHNTASSADGGEAAEYQAAVWMEALEDINPALLGEGMGEDEEEYDIMDELDDGEKKKKAKKGGKKRARSGATSGGGGTAAAGGLPKRFLPRTLGAILVEEANRYPYAVPSSTSTSTSTTSSSSTAHAFVQAEARLPPPQILPRRKFCPVTGLQGIYMEPKSGIPFANYKALEQIRERAPPWMTLSGGTSYFEAAQSLRDE